MNGQDFIRIAGEAFAPFLKGLGFAMGTPSISGRHYWISFTSTTHVVDVSYEPGEPGDALFVQVSMREKGKLSAFDDASKTLRLGDLNSRFMQFVRDEERNANEAVFRSVVAHDKMERLLLKFAKELRLVLPRYLQSL
jgi:hypothetical protein